MRHISCGFIVTIIYNKVSKLLQIEGELGFSQLRSGCIVLAL